MNINNIIREQYGKEVLYDTTKYTEALIEIREAIEEKLDEILSKKLTNHQYNEMKKS